jgi:hypothetical protein
VATCCKGRAFLTFSNTNATKKSEILRKRPDNLLGGGSVCGVLTMASEVGPPKKTICVSKAQAFVVESRDTLDNKHVLLARLQL